MMTVIQCKDKVMPGVRLCAACQAEQDAKAKTISGHIRRGSKDSQLNIALQSIAVRQELSARRFNLGDIDGCVRSSAGYDRVIRAGSTHEQVPSFGATQHRGIDRASC